MLIRFGSNDKKYLEKLEKAKNNTLNMIAYFKSEIKSMDTKSKQDSFPDKAQYDRYLQGLKDKLKKQEEKLDEILEEMDNVLKERT